MNIINNFPKKSAGRLMNTDVPVVNVNENIDFIVKKLLTDINKIESINYIYVVNKSNTLKGVISIKELFRQPKETKISSVMIKNPITAGPKMNQEKIAYLTLKNNIKSIPIVNKENKLLGAVLSDSILNVVYNELQEDISHFAGVSHLPSNIDDISSMSLYHSLKNRLPWLILGIIGGIIAAKVIGLFEQTLSKNIILAAFIPLIVYIASAVATQAGFFIVRDLAIHKKFNFLSYIFKQFKVILSMGFLISILIYGFTFLVYRDLSISIVLSLSIFLTILSSIITGIFIPYTFSKLKFDPANASGPIATIIQDLVSVTIYLLIASFLF
ncbi:magnesium transporter [Patescibacteria group bacterium]|nr:magnesium transporter [Patescibacteria group bacterium]